MDRSLVHVQGVELADWTQFIVASNVDTIKQQLVFKFPNGYGASIIRGPLTYGGNRGLFELGVIRFTSKTQWDLVYSTPVTNDVLGGLTGNEVLATLAEIQVLPIPQPE
jgi:hypothetical protein